MKKNIILGVSGSIAAYKAAELTSLLVKRGHDVFVVMTASATQLVGPITFQTLSRNPVTTGVFDEKETWHPSHIALADTADLLVVAPATANIIAKLACGIADDALTSIALACPAPLLVAPAMNGKMWLHPATRTNTATLVSRGAHFIGPAEGQLACGYEGIGRLWDVSAIADAAEAILQARRPPNSPQLNPLEKNQAKSKKNR